jgi:hypothetical protein
MDDEVGGPRRHGQTCFPATLPKHAGVMVIGPSNRCAGIRGRRADGHLRGAVYPHVVVELARVEADDAVYPARMKLQRRELRIAWVAAEARLEERRR